MDSDGEDDTPPLLLAAYEGDLPALRWAIADGADVNVEDFGYLQRIADAGGWEAYRRAHVDKLALLFAPKPETGSKRRRSKRRRSPLHGLPPELVRRVVEYWAHAGYY